MNSFARFLLIWLAACAAASHAAQDPKPSSSISDLDRIVAAVNDEVITRVELDRESRMATEQLRRQGTPLPARDILEKQLLERMITKRTLLQVAKQTGLRVSDGDIDTAITRIAQENKMTPAVLRDTVERDGIPFNRFREDVRGEMLIARLREREVESHVAVNDAEIQSFLKTQDNTGGKVDEYNLSHILVTVPEQATPEELRIRRGRADTALAQLRQGADFRQVAASYSDAPDAFEGGSMGWRAAARLPTMFLDSLKGMTVGQTSEVMRSPAGFHILKLMDK
ncbi:MAG: peptidylprolyl isomerase, partial [Betaproteobacteria bacterium]